MAAIGFGDARNPELAACDLHKFIPNSARYGAVAVSVVMHDIVPCHLSGNLMEFMVQSAIGHHNFFFLVQIKKGKWTMAMKQHQHMAPSHFSIFRSDHCFPANVVSS